MAGAYLLAPLPPRQSFVRSANLGRTPAGRLEDGWLITLRPGGLCMPQGDSTATILPSEAINELDRGPRRG